MKMTLSEALSCPPRTTFDEWGEYIHKCKLIDRQIDKVNEYIYDLNYALEEILFDEVGSERYNRKVAERDKAEKKLKRLYKKKEELECIVWKK